MSSEERISITKGSEIEVYSNEDGSTKAWYKAILEEAIPKSKRRKLLVRYLTPLKEGSSTTPITKRIDQTSIRPVPPRDLYGEVDFEEGDLVEAACKEGWWNGVVVKVLQNGRYKVYFELFRDVIEFERKNLRLRLDWIDGKWIRSEKQQLSKFEFRAGMEVEVRDEIENLGEVWIPAIYITNKGNGKVCVKYKRDTKYGVIKVNSHDIRSTPPPFEFREYKLVEHVDALLDSGWCRGVVSQVLPENRYTVLIGQKQVSMDFNCLDLRPAGEWKDGVWQKEPKDAYDSKQILDTGNNQLAVGEKASSTRIRVTVPALLDDNAACIEKKSMVTRSSGGTILVPPVAALSQGGDAVQVGKLFVASTGVQCTRKSMDLAETLIQSDIDPNKTAALSGELDSKLTYSVTNGDLLVTRPQEIATSKDRSSIVLGVAAALVKGSATKTQGKTSPRKKLQVMRNQNQNQKGLENDSAGEKKVPEGNQNRESVHKRKRGQPRKFIGIEPKQQPGVSANSSKAATTDLGDMTDDQPLAAWIHSGNSSSGTSISRTPDPVMNSVVEKRVDVVETPVVSDSTMILPFAKKSPVWKVLESMEAFKAVPQRPHFSPLLESKEEFREGSAIGAMVIFSGLIERVNNLQVDDPITSINSISESFTELEKHGFDVTVPQSRISKLLSMKRNQIGTMEELKVIDRKITENEIKRRKCDEEKEEISRKIHELQREQAAIKEVKGKLDKEKTGLQCNYRNLDGKLQIVDYEFQMTVAAPWK